VLETRHADDRTFSKRMASHVRMRRELGRKRMGRAADERPLRRWVRRMDRVSYVRLRGDALDELRASRPRRPPGRIDASHAFHGQGDGGHERRRCPLVGGIPTAWGGKANLRDGEPRPHRGNARPRRGSPGDRRGNASLHRGNPSHRHGNPSDGLRNRSQQAPFEFRYGRSRSHEGVCEGDDGHSRTRAGTLVRRTSATPAARRYRPRMGCGQWPGPESNRRHADFQSAALPTELPGRGHGGGARCGAPAHLVKPSAFVPFPSTVASSLRRSP
jgi:hypothetical protein